MLRESRENERKPLVTPDKEATFFVESDGDLPADTFYHFNPLEGFEELNAILRAVIEPENVFIERIVPFFYLDAVGNAENVFQGQ